MAHVITSHTKNSPDIDFYFMFCSVIFNCFKLASFHSLPNLSSLLTVFLAHGLGICCPRNKYWKRICQ